MQKKWWILIGILIIVVIFAYSRYEEVRLSPALTPSFGDGCSLMVTNQNPPPMTPEMIAACNEYCDLNFPDEPGCREAIEILEGIPADCFAEDKCLDQHPSIDKNNPNQIYPPEKCEVTKSKTGKFEVDMDCEVCADGVFACFCKKFRES